MKRTIVISIIALALTATVTVGGIAWFTTALATHSLGNTTGIPAKINHQGVVTVDGTRFTGTGTFFFAMVDPDSGNNLWTNDGSQISTANPPTAGVTLNVNDGIYQVRLGDTSLTNMTAIGQSVFTDDNVVLRIWFDDGSANGKQRLTPDHHLDSVPYAFTVADGAITTSKLASDIGTWGKTNNDIAYTAGNVGIGTNTPQSALEVNGTATVNNITIPTNAASGKVLTSDANGLGTWQFGGKVLQTQVAIQSAESVFNDQDVWHFIFECSITPKRADSTIVAVATMNGATNGGHGRVMFQLVHDTTSGGTSGTQLTIAEVAHDDSGVLGISSASLMGAVAPGNTSTRYFKINAAHGDSVKGWYVNRYSSGSSILLMEIAPD